MGAAGDVEIEPMRRIECDQRREAVAPVGDVMKRFRIRRLIGVVHLQMRTDGAGIGERQPDREAVTRRRVIQRIDYKRIVLLDDNDARYFSLRAVARLKRALDAVDGQAWQPQAENPPLR